MTAMTQINRIGVGVALAALVAVGVRLTAAQDAPQQDPKLALRDQVLASKACSGCDLSGISFPKESNLKNADLSSAKLVGASFYGADLTGANLQGADLTNANLWQADLTNANLGGVNLNGANLGGSKGADLVTAVTNDKTTCPDGNAGPCR